MLIINVTISLSMANRLKHCCLVGFLTQLKWFDSIDKLIKKTKGQMASPL